MRGRYLITGSQIGELIALIQVGESKDAMERLKNISDEQFLGQSKNEIKFDVFKASGIRW